MTKRMCNSKYKMKDKKCVIANSKRTIKRNMQLSM
jgi:hypothetical protein